MRLWQFSQREMLARPGRAFLTLMSIVIGVATAISVSLATSTTERASREMFSTVGGGAEIEVVSDNSERFPLEVATAVQKVPGIKSAIPQVQRPTIMYLPNNKRLKLLAQGLEFAGDAPPDLKLVEGRFFRQRDEVVLNKALAKGTGIKVGDTVEMLGRRGALIDFNVVGLVSPPAAAEFSVSPGIYMGLAGVDQLLTKKLELNSISITRQETISVKELIADINKVLPKGLKARVPPGQGEASQEMLLSLQQGLKFASALSMAMAAFIILNTYLMNVGERRKSLAVMRAIGATRLQIITMLLREGFLMGIVGTIIGVPVGILGARALLVLMGMVVKNQLPAPQLSLSGMLLACLLGPTVSLIATFFPARRAGQISPLEGMNPVSQADLEPFPIRITVIALGGWVLSAVLLTLTLTGMLPALVAIPAGVLMMISFVLITPILLGPLASLVSTLIRPLAGVEGRLAEKQLLRKRVRTTLTIGVLIVAIANGIGIGNTVINILNDVRTWHRRMFAGDFFLKTVATEGGSGLSGLQSDAILKGIRALPGVQNVETVRFVSARSGTTPVLVIARSLSDKVKLPFDGPEQDAATLRAQLRAGEVVIGTVLATRTGLKVGDEIDIELPSRSAKAKIAGLTDDYLYGGLLVFCETATAKKKFEIEGADIYQVYAVKDKSRDLGASLAGIAKKDNLILQSFGDLRSQLDTILSAVEGCFWGLLALGFVVASFGVVNTLTMSVLEQTRELGLLRVVGMTSGQVRKTMLCQAVLLAIIGIFLGGIAGVVSAYITNLSNQPILGHPVDFVLHYNMLLLSFVGAFFIVLLAAWFPSERAARLDLPEALQYE